MKQKTSIEWLIEQWPILESQIPPRILDQAKEMNEQQIAQAWEDGNYNYFHSKNNGVDFEHGLEYYREKYGEKNNLVD